MLTAALPEARIGALYKYTFFGPSSKISLSIPLFTIFLSSRIILFGTPSFTTIPFIPVTASLGSGSVNLKTQAFNILAGEGIDTSGSNNTITISGEDATTANKGIASFDSSDFQVSSGAVSLASNLTIPTMSIGEDLGVGKDLSVTGNTLLQGNLVVQGTSSFQHQDNLDVADRFIRLASGSSANGDGGIAMAIALG